MKSRLTEEQKISGIRAIISVTAALLVSAGWVLICNSISYEKTEPVKKNNITNNTFPVLSTPDTLAICPTYTPVFYKEFKTR